MRLFHILPRPAWRRAVAAGRYAPPSLETEGFIHLSTAAQVGPTRARFFDGVPDLCLLELDGAILGSALHWADVVHEDGSRGRFPHLHRALDPGEAAEVDWDAVG